MQLHRDEGLRKKPYRDTVGKLTIGVGRNLDDVGLALDEIELMLDNDIKRAEEMMLKSLPWAAGLDEARKAVLINMCFNLGIVGLLGFKRTLAAIKRGDYLQASVDMVQSKWAGQVGDRARRLAQQMRDGVWV